MTERNRLRDRNDVLELQNARFRSASTENVRNSNTDSHNTDIATRLATTTRPRNKSSRSSVEIAPSQRTSLTEQIDATPTIVDTEHAHACTTRAKSSFPLALAHCRSRSKRLLVLDAAHTTEIAVTQQRASTTIEPAMAAPLASVNTAIKLAGEQYAVSDILAARCRFSRQNVIADRYRKFDATRQATLLRQSGWAIGARVSTEKQRAREHKCEKDEKADDA